MMLLVCAVIRAAACLRTHPTQGFAHDYNRHGLELAPQHHEQHAALEHCMEVLIDKCVKQISAYKSCERTDLCKECSDQLIQMGKVCNQKLSNTLSRPDFWGSLIGGFVASEFVNQIIKFATG